MCHPESHRDIVYHILRIILVSIEEGVAFVLSLNGQTLSFRVRYIISMEPYRPHEVVWRVVAQVHQYKLHCRNKPLRSSP